MDQFLPTYLLYYLAVLPFVIVFAVHADTSRRYNVILDTTFLWIASFVLVYLFGSRGYDVGTDTFRYYDSYTYMMRQTTLEAALGTPHIGRDPVFNLVIYGLSKFLGVREYFYVVASLCVLPITVAICILTRRNRLLLFFGFLSLFIFPNLGINIVRNGMSLAFLVLAAVYYFQENKRGVIISLVVSLLFHASTVLVIVAIIGVRLIKHYTVIWVLFLLTAALGIVGIGIQHMPVVGSYIGAIDRLSAYLQGDESIARLPLTTFGMLTLTAIYHFIMSRQLKDPNYLFIGKVFLLVTCIYFFTSTLSYSYRLAIYAWIFVPILLAYPLLKQPVFKRLPSVILFLLFLCFELFSMYQLKQFL